MLWPMSLVAVAVVSARCVMVWLRLQADAQKRAVERDEATHGIKAIVEEAREEMRTARLEMKTFVANNRRQ